MLKHSIFLTLLMILSLGGYSMDKDTVLLNRLPEETELLTVESEEIIKTRKPFYDYINGGAELYLNYGFQKLAKRIYSSGKGTLKAEIYDMGSPKNAYGVFSYANEEINAGVGQGAQYLGGSLIFWKDKYYVSVFADQETDYTREEIITISKKISNAIENTGELPGIFQVTPEKSLDRESTFYFHNPAWQNKLFYISNENIFNINEDVKAVINKYKNGERKYYLLLAEYPDKKTARKAHKKSRKHFSKKLKHNRIIQNSDNEWIGCDRTDKLLIFTFKAPSKEDAAYLLDKSAQNYAKCSNK